ncbi:MAG TPA: NADP-dependent phosphogluconate dehydrogenase [Vicinamibacterales bacterium]|nr:NADP-dependent phosphogluconate dehydrogenase [Vicinamibacterales bacterium]
MKYAMGVVGLGVMGANLARNIASRGFAVAGYDLDAKKTAAFVEESGNDSAIGGVDSPAALMAALERPRRILIMVPAGKPVDSVIAMLKPHLEPGDILIDGGNSYFADTDRRSDELTAAGFHFVGAGVSGGEEGALRGPAIMPGGPKDAWQAVAPILTAIAAKADDGEPCVAYMGPRGAGHYVKMVHNGIEYGDMQLIAEAYDLLHRGAGMPSSELAAMFADWNRGDLRSYLIEITAEILAFPDADTGSPLVEMILDEAQQKGTGKWMSQNAFDVGAPIPTVNAAVEARLLSALKSERVVASTLLSGPSDRYSGTRDKLVDAVRQALYASKVTSYAQGMALLRIASKEYGYGIDPGEVARIWRAGCIIRAALLGDIRDAFRRKPDLVNLLLDDAFRNAIAERQDGWRFVVQTAVGLGIPIPAMSASLAYFDSYRSARLPANLTQAQRDFFGAHTYRRIDREGVVHTDWSTQTS